MSENAEKPASNWMRHPLFILFAVGSVAMVVGTSMANKRQWGEFTERAREQVSRYPVVAERIGEITKITIDPERRASITNENQVAMDLFGTIDIGTIQVEIVDGAHGYELVVGETLHVGGQSFPLEERSDPAPSATEPARDE